MAQSRLQQRGPAARSEDAVSLYFWQVKSVYLYSAQSAMERRWRRLAEKRGDQETNAGTAANKRRGGRGRVAAGVKEVNVCDNLKKGACGRHTWGYSADLNLETTK